MNNQNIESELKSILRLSRRDSPLKGLLARESHDSIVVYPFLGGETLLKDSFMRSPVLRSNGFDSDAKLGNIGNMIRHPYELGQSFTFSEGNIKNQADELERQINAYYENIHENIRRSGGRDLLEEQMFNPEMLFWKEHAIGNLLAKELRIRIGIINQNYLIE